MTENETHDGIAQTRDGSDSPETGADSGPSAAAADLVVRPVALGDIDDVFELSREAGVGMTIGSVFGRIAGEQAARRGNRLAAEQAETAA